MPTLTMVNPPVNFEKTTLVNILTKTEANCIRYGVN
jgi:hypothetical protein